MPELPDVESFRKTAQKALGKRIDEVSINMNRMFEASDSSLRKHLKGNKMGKTKRHGKYLFLRINRGKWLVLHFGMTGDVTYAKEESDHSIIVLGFSNGRKLCIISVRKLGTVDLADEVGDYIEKKGLGPDAMDISRDEFRKRIGGSRGSVKTALMDQKKVAGIGNIYADEILYQSGIHPKRKIGDINEKKLEEMHKNMLRIFKTAIRNNANPDEFPRSYLLHNREDGGSCSGGRIKKITVNGRSTYYCPAVQK